MKEHKWDAAVETSQELFGASITPEDETRDAGVMEKPRKSRLTDLRRRIEERLDSKRISMELDEF